jgi:hypothetical protein
LSQSSGSDFENEVVSLGDHEDFEVPEVLTAETNDESVPNAATYRIAPQKILETVLVTDDSGVISQVISSPEKKIRGTRSPGHNYMRSERESRSQVMAVCSQVINPSQQSQVQLPDSQDLGQMQTLTGIAMKHSWGPPPLPQLFGNY